MALTITDAGNGTSTSSGATVATGATVTASVGDWLVAVIGADNAGASGVASLTTVTDSAGNTWTQRAKPNQTAGATNDGATLGIFVCEGVTNALSSGTVTANFSPNTTSKAIEVYRVQPGAGETVQFVACDATGTTGGSTTHNAPTVSVTNGHTIFGCAAVEVFAGDTGDSDTTNGNWSAIINRVANTGTAATSMVCASQFKTVNATGNQSWASTSAVSRDFAATYLVIAPIAAGPVGTASITEADDTVASAATLALKGTASITEAADTLVATATLALKGTASIAEAGDTLAATGTLALKGTASIAEADDTILATGALLIKGTLSVTEADDTLVAAGVGGHFALVDITEADDTVMATGTIAIKGVVNITEANDSTSSAAAIAIIGTLSVTEASDTLFATGTLAIKGTLAATETNDSIASTGVLAIHGVVNVVEDDDRVEATADIVGGASGSSGKRGRDATLWAKRKLERERRMLELEDAIAAGQQAEEHLRALAIRYKKEGIDFEELVNDWFMANSRAASEVDEDEAIDILLLSM